jgi:hypothetical protein
MGAGKRVILYSVASALLFGTLAVSASQEAFPGANACSLHSAHGQISHVIVVTFDNVHFTRDDPGVPSDLEQMPHLLNFIEANGTLLSNHHAGLTSHASSDLVTALTGVYGDRNGVSVGDIYRYVNPDGTSNPASSLAYWTAPVFDPSTPSPSDTRYNLVTADGHNAPAPWVPFTRAGCNVGMIATPNTVLENVATDVPAVFGAGSPEAKEAIASPSQAAADFLGIAVHCAAGQALCTAANHGRPDLLPDELGGYSGYSALFGNRYLAPLLSARGAMKDISGAPVTDTAGRPGFPGRDRMSAPVSLSYVAAMQEHGIPVTYAFIASLHDDHGSGQSYGPGQAGYVAALKATDAAFVTFFARLQADGIDQTNTLFVLSADEGAHFAGSPSSPVGCDGVATPCAYQQVGATSANLIGLLAKQGVNASFMALPDAAPAIYVTGNPARDSTATRSLERGIAAISVQNPYTQNTAPLIALMADPVEMKLLHMTTGDPARLPSAVFFAMPDYSLGLGPANCASACLAVKPSTAWNRGTVSPDVTTTWAALVGPGIMPQGVMDGLFSDQADLRPTMLSILGLQDDYVGQGRVLFETFADWATPPALRSAAALPLAQAYKQINAPLGDLAMASLTLSTQALASGDAQDDAAYQQSEAFLQSVTSRRDALAQQMAELLANASFRGAAISQAQAQDLVRQSLDLVSSVSDQITGP